MCRQSTYRSPAGQSYTLPVTVAVVPPVVCTDSPSKVTTERSGKKEEETHPLEVLDGGRVVLLQAEAVPEDHPSAVPQAILVHHRLRQVR